MPVKAQFFELLSGFFWIGHLTHPAQMVGSGEATDGLFYCPCGGGACRAFGSEQGAGLDAHLSKHHVARNSLLPFVLHKKDKTVPRPEIARPRIKGWSKYGFIHMRAGAIQPSDAQDNQTLYLVNGFISVCRTGHRLLLLKDQMPTPEEIEAFSHMVAEKAETPEATARLEQLNARIADITKQIADADNSGVADGDPAACRDRARAAFSALAADVGKRQVVGEPNNLFNDFVRKHQLAVENLTEQQLAEAIRQAIAAGDFQRNVLQDGSAQSVVYIPYRESERFRGLYNELLFAVARIYEGETRHETALRYIRERESTTPEARVSTQELADNSWDIGIVSGVLQGIECTPTLLPNQKEAIADARKAIKRIESRNSRLVVMAVKPDAQP